MLVNLELRKIKRKMLNFLDLLLTLKKLEIESSKLGESYIAAVDLRELCDKIYRNLFPWRLYLNKHKNETVLNDLDSSLENDLRELEDSLRTAIRSILNPSDGIFDMVFHEVAMTNRNAKLEEIFNRFSNLIWSIFPNLEDSLKSISSLSMKKDFRVEAEVQLSQKQAIREFIQRIDEDDDIDCLVSVLQVWQEVAESEDFTFGEIIFYYFTVNNPSLDNIESDLYEEVRLYAELCGLDQFRFSLKDVYFICDLLTSGVGNVLTFEELCTYFKMEYEGRVSFSPSMVRSMR